MMKHSVRRLTEGAMMLAIIGVFLFLNLQSAGLLEAYFIWALPLPIIFYVVKHGFKAGALLAGSSLLLTLISGNLITLFYIVGAIVVGLTYGWGVARDRSNGWLIASTTLLTSVSLLIEMYLLAAFFGYDLLRETRVIVDQLSSVQGMLLPEDMTQLILAVYPIALLVMAFLQALVTHFMAILLLKRLNIKTRRMRPIYDFRLPMWAAALALVGLFVGSLLGRDPSSSLRIPMTLLITVSSLLLIGNAYLFILRFARLRQKRFLPFVALLALVVLPSLMIYVLIGLGLLDAFTDLRQRIESPQR